MSLRLHRDRRRSSHSGNMGDAMKNVFKVGGMLVAAAALAMGSFAPHAIAASPEAAASTSSSSKHDPVVPRVILISLDGAKPQFIEKFIATHVLPSDSGLGLLRRRGSRAIQNITATPSLTAVSHLAIATGSTAVHNDVPSNTFHAVASPITATISGFAAPIGGYQINPLGPTANPTARPLWLTLREKGFTVATATWPGGDGADIKINGVVTQAAVPTRTVDYTLPFGAFGGLGAQGLVLTAANFAPDATIQNQLAAAGHTVFSPVQVSTAPFETVFCAPTAAATCGTTNANGRTLVYAMTAAVLDTTNDQAVNYDTLASFDPGQPVPVGPVTPPSTGPAYAKLGQSAPFFFEGSGNVVGAAYFAVNIGANLAEVRFARYGANFIPQNAAALEEADGVNSTLGFWVPQPDFRIPERLSPGFADFSDEALEAMHEDQVDTFIAYQTKIALNAIDQNPDADLLMIYFEEPDGATHQYLLTDPRQASNSRDPSTIGSGQDAAKVARNGSYLQNAYRRANDAVDAIIKAVGTRHGVPRSDIIVVSDHGFAPFHTAVSSNNLLAAALVSGGFSPALINTGVVIRTS